MNNIEIIDYSEKSVAVVGDTKNIKESLDVWIVKGEIMVLLERLKKFKFFLKKCCSIKIFCIFAAN